MNHNRGQIYTLFGVVVLIGLTAFGALHLLALNKIQKKANRITRHDVRKWVNPSIIGSKKIQTNLIPIHKELLGEITIDLNLQNKVVRLVEKYNPDFASIVIMNSNTGEILSMVDHVKDPKSKWNKINLSTGATYPAASIFKIITAAAALENGVLELNDEISFNGKSTTLYHYNLSPKIHKWTRWMSLKSAFAKSANPVFGKLGLHHLGGQALRIYAKKFGFNQDFKFDFPISRSIAKIPLSGYGVAESASGFTRNTTLSPVQGAMIASSIANGGKMVAPYLINRVIKKQKGKPAQEIYRVKKRILNRPVTDRVATSLAAMMRETIKNGTARGSFRGHRRDRVLKKIELGGKTGSLRGKNPRGKYDWFIGYGKIKENTKVQVGIAVMIINEDYWTVKSARLAREILRTYFKDKISL